MSNLCALGIDKGVFLTSVVDSRNPTLALGADGGGTSGSAVNRRATKRTPVVPDISPRPAQLRSFRYPQGLSAVHSRAIPAPWPGTSSSGARPDAALTGRSVGALPTRGGFTPLCSSGFIQWRRSYDRSRGSPLHLSRARPCERSGGPHAHCCGPPDPRFPARPWTLNPHLPSPRGRLETFNQSDVALRLPRLPPQSIISGIDLRVDRICVDAVDASVPPTPGVHRSVSGLSIRRNAHGDRPGGVLSFRIFLVHRGRAHSRQPN